MIARLDKMEGADLIRRLRDPDDRRGVVVELTEHGRELWEQSVQLQMEKESVVSATLDDERDLLNDLLRRLLRAFADAYGPVARRRA